jgi:uncharacterized protein YhbP (UPF0306 family)
MPRLWNSVDMADENRQLIERITRFIDENHVMALATAGPNGPHAANLFYARDGLCLVWVSDKESRHSQQIVLEPRVSAVIAPDISDYALIRGVQIHGTGRCVTDKNERARLLDVLAARYPFLAKLNEAPARMAVAFESAAVYALHPRQIVLIDNSLGFGHKETLVLPTSNGSPPLELS